MFDAASIPVPPVPVQTFILVPDTSVSSARLQYRYRTLRKIRYSINIATGRFGKFGMTYIPIPDSLVSSAQQSVPVADTSVSSV